MVTFIVFILLILRRSKLSLQGFSRTTQGCSVSSQQQGAGSSHQLEMFGAMGTNPRVEAEDSGPLGKKGCWEGTRTLGWGGAYGCPPQTPCSPAPESHFSGGTVLSGLCPYTHPLALAVKIPGHLVSPALAQMRKLKRGEVI